jgi:hypothetical protein
MRRRHRDVRPPCIGSASVMPVPAGMTAEQAWDEITALGKLHTTPPTKGLTWACVECPGGEDCECRYHYRSSLLYRRFHNDRLVEVLLFGYPVPKVLFPLVRAWGALRK